MGGGTVARAGFKVTAHYTGWLADGTKFDSSVDRGQPFTFTLGVHEVIAGWDEGISGMRAGGTRKLIIPPSLGYGSQRAGKIPPNSILVFDVTLVSVQP
jgi:FKBP-type peptidyl-prolyl cis-trans isomerase FkpA